MFNFLNNWTIAKKLGAVTVVLVLGLVILGAAFYQLLLLDEAEANEHRDREHFSALVSDIQIRMLSAARYQVDYLRTLDEQLFERQATALDRAFKGLINAKGEAKSEHEHEFLLAYTEKLKSLQDDFQLIVALTRDLGDENSGLIKAWDAAAQRLAQLSAAQSVMAVHNGLTVVRVAARDFAADPSEARLQTWTAAMGDLDRSILGADNARLRDAADKYRATFAPVIERKLLVATLVEAIAATEEELDYLVEQLAEATHLADQQAALEKEPVYQSLTLMFFAIMGIVAILVGLALFFFVRDLISSTRELTRVMQAFQSGNNDERVSLDTHDELGQLGSTFNYMLDARVQAIEEAQRESDTLNTNVINLLQTVFQLSQKDLTARAQVTEDVTGPMADALNQLAGDTAAVLAGVVSVAGDVSRAAQSTRAQSESMSSLAASEREVTEQAVAQLLLASAEMEDISTSAQEANVRADAAMASTREAMESVVSTVAGINGTRDTIREAEKRVKRLGERAQEISEAVGLINTIAERTHILALNASMHAASAGEAGRGFAVVADEVQHLAENARQATQQISTLVGNIQRETNDTVNSINDTISQVVAGSQIAERAGAQMRQTEEATQALVEAVNSIAQRSAAQAEVNSRLQTQVGEVQASTVETERRVLEQVEQSEHLVQYAASLVDSVSVFTLPDSTPTQH